MGRSLIRQLEQVRRAATYSDAIASANTSAVAEPTISGSLEQDTNIIRTLLKQLKGTSTWYDDPGTYFDPTSTTSGSSSTKQMSLVNIKGNTLDSKTIIIAVTNNNSGSGFTVASGTAGILMTTSTSYATHTNRVGLPIYSSTAHVGTYHDESGSDNVCRVDLINTLTGAEFKDLSGNIIYGKLHDGSDNSGSGSGTDVYIKFYANGSVCTLPNGDVTKVTVIYPYRKLMSSMNEYDWQRTDFISAWEGDVELLADISNLWSYTGSADGTSAPTWTNTSSNYMLASNPSTLRLAIDYINTGIGNRVYTEHNYVTAGQAITASIDALDQAVKDAADLAAAGTTAKYVESVSTLITANSAHALPYSILYTPCSTAGREGKNMDIYVDGQLLAADTGTNGANADRDYAETTTSGVTFRFDIQVGRNITYIVRA